MIWKGDKFKTTAANPYYNGSKNQIIKRLSKQQEKSRWKLTTMNVQGSQVYLFSN